MSSQLQPLESLPVPVDVAVCPYCGAPILVEIRGIYRSMWGTFEVVRYAMDCSAEPPEEGDAWDDWEDRHIPYRPDIWPEEDPVILRWINSQVEAQVIRKPQL